MPTAAQLNVRIDAELKRGGEAVLARYGLSPTDAVRGLWGYLAERQEPPAFLAEKGPKPGGAWTDDGCGLALSFLATPPASPGAAAAATPAAPWREERGALYDELLDRMERRCR